MKKKKKSSWRAGLKPCWPHWLVPCYWGLESGPGLELELCLLPLGQLTQGALPRPGDIGPSRASSDFSGTGQ